MHADLEGFNSRLGGVRTSSAAATFKMQADRRIGSGLLNHVAAPEDGRTPNVVEWKYETRQRDAGGPRLVRTGETPLALKRPPLLAAFEAGSFRIRGTEGWGIAAAMPYQ